MLTDEEINKIGGWIQLSEYYDDPPLDLISKMFEACTEWVCCCGEPLNNSHDHMSCGPPIRQSKGTSNA